MLEEEIIKLVNTETDLFRSNINQMLITDSISELFFIRRWQIKCVNRILILKLKHWKALLKRENEKK